MAVDKKKLFKNAWTLAKNKTFTEGGTTKEWFAYALTQAWKIENAHKAVKETPARVETETKVIRIKDWFIAKNFDLNDMRIWDDRQTVETIEETEKAVRIKIIAWTGQNFTTWVPKSCLAA